MRKAFRIAALFLLALAVCYAGLMAAFEGPLCLDLTKSVKLSQEERSLALPRYMQAGVSYDGKLEGTDADGNSYTWFCYAMPEIFESAEMHCVVQWDTGEVIAFIGESRAMSVIDKQFPDVEWN